MPLLIYLIKNKLQNISVLTLKIHMKFDFIDIINFFLLVAQNKREPYQW
jgi:hypothetical protein